VQANRKKFTYSQYYSWKPIKNAHKIQIISTLKQMDFWMQVWKSKQSAIRDLEGFISHISAHFMGIFKLQLIFCNNSSDRIPLKSLISWKSKIRSLNWNPRTGFLKKSFPTNCSFSSKHLLQFRLNLFQILWSKRSFQLLHFTPK